MREAGGMPAFFFPSKQGVLRFAMGHGEVHARAAHAGNAPRPLFWRDKRAAAEVLFSRRFSSGFALKSRHWTVRVFITRPMQKRGRVQGRTLTNTAARSPGE